MTFWGIVIVLVIWGVVSAIGVLCAIEDDDFGPTLLLSPILLIHMFFFYKYIWL